MADDGTRTPYDQLMIATGSRPFVPPMEGLQTVTPTSAAARR